MSRLDAIALSLRANAQVMWPDATTIDEVMVEDPAMNMNAYREILSVRVSFTTSEIYDIFIAKLALLELKDPNSKYIFADIINKNKEQTEMGNKEEKLRSEIARLGTKLNKRLRKANKTRDKLEVLQDKVNKRDKKSNSTEVKP